MSLTSPSVCTPRCNHLDISFRHFMPPSAKFRLAPCRFLGVRALAPQRTDGAGLQRPWRPERVLHRYTGVQGQTDETLTPQGSASSSDEGNVSATGNPEATLLQNNHEPGTGGSPGNSPLIPQLYLFGRCVSVPTSTQANSFVMSVLLLVYIGGESLWTSEGTHLQFHLLFSCLFVLMCVLCPSAVLCYGEQVLQP